MAEEQPAAQDYRIAPRRGRSLGGKLGLGALILAGTAVIAYPLIQDSGVATRLETSEAEEYQDALDGNGFGRMSVEEVAEPSRAATPQFDPGPLEDELDAQRSALEKQNAKLSADVKALQVELARLEAAPADTGAGQVATALKEVQKQNAALIEQLQKTMETRLAEASLDVEKRIARETTDRQAASDKLAAQLEQQSERTRVTDTRLEQLMEQILGLQRQTDALQQQIDEGMGDASRAQSERDRQEAEEATRRAELQRRRQEAQARRDAQVRSEGVIFDAGGQTASSAAPAEAEVRSGDAAARAFVLEGAEPVATTTAEVIANPSHTILQGTILEATLETAIDSGLPGQITAIVNRPVWSFDGANILIPAGARLFGTYSSDISLGQSRILVGWTRIVTPEGQSVELAAFGADDQGRSGITGRVKSRFGLRFGAAALLSIIGTGPALAASEARTEAGAQVAENVAGNFAQTTNAVIGAYATLPPVISVQPGTAISVIVDRDLEFF